MIGRYRKGVAVTPRRARIPRSGRDPLRNPAQIPPRHESRPDWGTRVDLDGPTRDIASGGSGSPARPGTTKRGHMQTPAPFGYERATSVSHAVALLEQLGPEARLVAGRPLAAPDDEAAPRPARAPHRHQRPRRRALLRPPRGRRAADRGDDPPRRAAVVGRRRRALPDLPRRRAGHRRPGRPQPWDRRRLARPGRPERGPVGGVRRAAGKRRDPRLGRIADRVRPRLPHRPVRDRRARRRDDHRVPGARSGPVAAAPTARSSGGPATGPSPRPAPPSGSTATRSRDVGIGLTAVGAEHFCAPEAEDVAARATRSPTSCSTPPARSPPSTATRRPTSAARRTTSATSPAS